MARVPTTILSLGTWADGDNPGAGSQSVDSTGLNGNWMKLDLAVGTEHNTNGTHKSDVITGANIKNTIVDGTTIEATATTGAKTFRVKDLGISTAKLADLAVTAAKLADSAVSTAAKIVDGIITAAKLVDGTLTTAKYADDSVTAAKQPHDNNARKYQLCLVLAAGGGATGPAMRLERAGAITGFSVYSTNANGGVTQAYATAVGASTGKFSAGQFIGFGRNTSTGVCIAKISGTNVTAMTVGDSNWAVDTINVTIEVEFDD